MQLISKFNQRIRFLLCVIDIYSKYEWVVPLKDKKGIRITNAFQILDQPKSDGRKPNKIWVDKGSDLYNRTRKLWLQYNSIEMYSTHDEGKFVAAERFIGALNNEI